MSNSEPVHYFELLAAEVARDSADEFGEARFQATVSTLQMVQQVCEQRKVPIDIQNREISKWLDTMKARRYRTVVPTRAEVQAELDRSIQSEMLTPNEGRQSPQALTRLTRGNRCH